MTILGQSLKIRGTEGSSAISPDKGDKGGGFRMACFISIEKFIVKWYMIPMDTQLPQQVSELIERFERNKESYTSVQYNEAQLRQEFINPFFEALGWDVRNIGGNAEAYKDVIHEDAIKIGSAVKAPDYCFRIGGTRKFFVEAKKPAIKLDDNSDAAFQLRRYAWSAKLPLGILTNFKEFAV